MLYSQSKEDLVLTFNAQNTNNTNWFAEANLQTSPWQDIYSINKNFFSLVGFCHSDRCRNFYINNKHGGCPSDTGWLCIGNLNGCDWEKNMERIRFSTASQPLLTGILAVSLLVDNLTTHYTSIIVSNHRAIRTFCIYVFH